MKTMRLSENSQKNIYFRRALVYLAFVVFILIGNYTIFNITLYSMTLLMVSAVVIIDMLYQIVNKSVNPKSLVFKYKLACILSFLNIIFVYLNNSMWNGSRLFLIGTNILVSFAISLYFREEQVIRKFLYVLVGLVTISSLVVIGQYFHISLAYALIDIFKAGTAETFEMSVNDSRYYGLAKDTIHFGYQCSTAIVILIFLEQKRKTTFSRLLKYLSLFILVLGLLFSRTRISEFVVLLAVIIKALSVIKQGSPTKKLMVILGIMIFAFWGTGLFELQFMQNAMRISSFDNGALSRIPMLLTALNHALHYPLGMGAYRVDPTLVVGLLNPGQFSYVMQYTAHNLLGNCAACFGLIGLSLMIYIYRLILRAYKKTKNMITKEYDLLLAITIGIAGLFINAMTHNTYIFSGDLFSWALFGCLMALYEKSRNELE